MATTPAQPAAPGKKKGNKFVVVLAIVLLAAGGTWLYVQHRTSEDIDKQGVSILQQAQQYRNQNKDDQARKVLLDYLDKHPTNKDQRATAELQVGSIYATRQDWPNARIWLERGLHDTTNPNQALYENLAQICAKLKDNSAAVDYYKKAKVVITQKAAPDSTPALLNIDQQIIRLGGQP